MGKWFGGGGSSSGGGTQDNKPPRRPDPYVTGNPNDWDKRDKNDGETARKDKKKK
jgi:hypothetical protein